MAKIASRFSRGCLQLLLVTFALGACASTPPKQTPVTSIGEIEPDVAEAPLAEAGDSAKPAQPSQPDAPAEPAKPGLGELCSRAPAGEEKFADSAERRLHQTFCAATLWFDGLFGGEPNVDSARRVSGRVLLAGIYTEYNDFEGNARLRLRYDLPNLERRVNIFLGRDDRDDFLQDRSERFLIRSQTLNLETDDQWLAGLGWSPPGRFLKQVDVRVGGKLKSAPEIFVQARYRRQFFWGEDSVFRFRETAFYENRDGFGLTTHLDFDHVISPQQLLRFANVGTFSEGTAGLSWRSALISYHNLGKNRALAGEIFARGATDADVRLWEYGARSIFRWPLGNPKLFGEVTVGYSWPREELFEKRDGSSILGFGVELVFGQEER